MASREGSVERNVRRARERVKRAIDEIRDARIGAGLSQAEVARRLDVSRSRVGRIERDEERLVPAELLLRMGGIVGLDIVLRGYPGPDPALDAAHRRLLKRLAASLGPDWWFRTEVPLPIANDQRAWDAVCTHRSTDLVIHVEAETRLGDIQALLRRLALKRRDGMAVRLVLVVADTRHDREVVRAAAADLAAAFPADPRKALASLRAGLDPGADALLLV